MSVRKTCEAVAAVVARMRLSHHSGTCDALCADLADALAATQPNFNRAKFYAACAADALGEDRPQRD
jgi:hypothetical protein